MIKSRIGALGGLLLGPEASRITRAGVVLTTASGLTL